MNNYIYKGYSEYSKKYVLEHIWIWENFMKTSVPKDEKGNTCYIHHFDGDRSNNNILNIVCMTKEEHGRIHNRGKWNKPMSENGRKNISLAGKGRIPPNKGISMNEETKQKISNIIKEKWKNKEYSEKTKNAYSKRVYHCRCKIIVNIFMGY